MKKFGRRTKHRINMIKNLAISTLLYEKVITTPTKAKEAIPIIDKAIVTAKQNNLNAKKELLSTLLNNKIVVKKLTEDLAPRFKDKNSGFVKLYKYSPRVGDNAPQVIMILSISKFLNNLSLPNVQKTSKDKVLSKKE